MLLLELLRNAVPPLARRPLILTVTSHAPPFPARVLSVDRRPLRGLWPADTDEVVLCITGLDDGPSALALTAVTSTDALHPHACKHPPSAHTRQST